MITNEQKLVLEARIKELEAGVLNKEGMALVTKEDANNYCRILTLLGMEEEGSPVEEVECLISLHEGMVCGDCRDTGWLENREEGRYPCTCMTEAEPYQLLEAERDDWKSRYESNLSVNQMHSDNNAEMLKFNAKLLAERDALKKQNSAYKVLTESKVNQLAEYRAMADKFREAINTLESEKEANAVLTQERDALKAKVAELEITTQQWRNFGQAKEDRIKELEVELAKRPPLFDDTRANVAVAVAQRRGAFIGSQDERIAELTRIIAGLRVEIAQAKAAERERCAAQCEGDASLWEEAARRGLAGAESKCDACTDCAIVIRALGDGRPEESHDPRP